MHFPESADSNGQNFENKFYIPPPDLPTFRNTPEKDKPTKWRAREVKPQPLDIYINTIRFTDFLYDRPGLGAILKQTGNPGFIDAITKTLDPNAELISAVQFEQMMTKLIPWPKSPIFNVKRNPNELRQYTDVLKATIPEYDPKIFLFDTKIWPVDWLKENEKVVETSRHSSISSFHPFSLKVSHHKLEFFTDLERTGELGIVKDELEYSQKRRSQFDAHPPSSAAILDTRIDLTPQIDKNNVNRQVVLFGIVMYVPRKTFPLPISPNRPKWTPL